MPPNTTIADLPTNMPSIYELSGWFGSEKVGEPLADRGEGKVIPFYDLKHFFLKGSPIGCALNSSPQGGT
jgi:hypothetical protein